MIFDKIEKLRKSSGYLDDSHGMLLFNAVTIFRPKLVVEIGFNRGYSAVCLCAGMKAAKINGKVVSIDINGKRSREIGVPNLKKYRLHPWHRLVVGDSTKVAERFEKQDPIDLLYIDGDHTYAGCKGDWDAYEKFLHGGSVVMFHDTINKGCPGVRKAIAEILRSGGWQFFEYPTLTRRTKAKFGACGTVIIQKKQEAWCDL